MAGTEYVWRDPDRGISIHIPLPAADRLASEAMEAYRALPHGGLEIGGLLLGDSAGSTISILDYVPVESEHRTGPAYRLSEADLMAFAAALLHHPEAIGIYRTTRYESLSLLEDDISLFYQHFRRREALYLLIDPAAGRAAFFLPENGSLVKVHDFEFRRGGLEGETAEPVPPAAAARPARTGRRSSWWIPVAAVLAGMAAGNLIYLYQHPSHKTPPPAPAVAPAPPPPNPTTVADSLRPSPTQPLPSPVEAKVRAPAHQKARARESADRAAAEADEPATPQPSPLTPAPKTAEPVKPVTTADAAGAPAPPSPPPKPAAAPAPNVPQPVVLVAIEAKGESRVRRTIGHVPLLRRLNKHSQSFVAPVLVRRVDPVFNTQDRRALTRRVDVDVRVLINDTGQVDDVEWIANRNRNPQFASLAINAARHWEFTPAREGDERVPGEVILHFRFLPEEPPPLQSQ
ncbi:MAG TPA: hypothetical protein VGS58_01090 [Candidatus Sulfopaludibacter sp.]|nr:hypothetical protein [Candidatus Sulfopaludibacter sp.]